MLDLTKVRHAYFHPPPDDLDRVLTREELYARYERRQVEGYLRRGGTRAGKVWVNTAP